MVGSEERQQRLMFAPIKSQRTKCANFWKNGTRHTPRSIETTLKETRLSRK